jgi:hypothetical protein
MLDRTSDWCFEGGCTYLTSLESRDNEAETDELEKIYREPCEGLCD